jgi:hypothetical protein
MRNDSSDDGSGAKSGRGGRMPQKPKHAAVPISSLDPEIIQDLALVDLRAGRLGDGLTQLFSDLRYLKKAVLRAGHLEGGFSQLVAELEYLKEAVEVQIQHHEELFELVSRLLNVLAP